MHDFQLYGHSLFETIKADHGSIPLLELHWQRLSFSAKELGFSCPDLPTFVQTLKNAHNPRQCQIIRFAILRMGGRWSSENSSDRIEILTRPFKKRERKPYKLLLPKQLVGSFDALRQHKTGARLTYQLLAKQALEKGADDCVLVDQQSRILETCFSNLIVFHQNRWITSSRHLGVLPGVFREWLLRHDKIEVGVISKETLLACTSVVVCNSVHGAIPVTQLLENHAVKTLNVGVANQWINTLPNPEAANF